MTWKAREEATAIVMREIAASQAIRGIGDRPFSFYFFFFFIFFFSPFCCFSHWMRHKNQTALSATLVQYHAAMAAEKKKERVERMVGLSYAATSRFFSMTWSGFTVLSLR